MRKTKDIRNLLDNNRNNIVVNKSVRLLRNIIQFSI